LRRFNEISDIEILETEEIWFQRAIDTPDEVIDELNQLKKKIQYPM
jgi:hypothetical protein